MATTTNYSWTTPDDTDLVKDGAAAIRTLGSSIDTTVFNNAGAAVDKSLIDAEGDLIVGDAADAVQRLAIGSNGNVLTVDTAVDGKIKWDAPAVSTTAWVNISTTSTTTGTSYTISSLSGYKSLRIFYKDISQDGVSAPFLRMRFNSDTGNNYNYVGAVINGGTTDTFDQDFNINHIPISRQSTNAADVNSGYIEIDGCAGASDKIGLILSGVSGTTSKRSFRTGFRYDAAAEISSITFLWSAGNFDGGSIDIWGSVN